MLVNNDCEPPTELDIQGEIFDMAGVLMSGENVGITLDGI